MKAVYIPLGSWTYTYTRCIDGTKSSTIIRAMLLHSSNIRVQVIWTTEVIEKDIIDG